MKRFVRSDFIRRVCAALIATALLAFVIRFAYTEVLNFSMVLALLSLAAVATWEFAQLLCAKGLTIPHRSMILGSLLMVFSFIVPIWIEGLDLLPLATLFLFISLFFFLHFNRIERAIFEVSAPIFSLIYIAVPLGMLFPIIYKEPGGGDGRWWLLYLLIVTKTTDITAYFGGKFFGRKKLAQRLSPHKTWEGAVSGFVGSVSLSLLFAAYGEKISWGLFSLSFSSALFLGIAIAITAQLGDLSESLLKRDAKVKDSNKLPGFGGILDMLDSLLFTIPLIYLYLHL